MQNCIPARKPGPQRKLQLKQIAAFHRRSISANPSLPAMMMRLLPVLTRSPRHQPQREC